MPKLPKQQVKEFTTAAGQAEPSEMTVPFLIDGETYEAVAIQPAGVALDLAQFADATQAQQARMFGDFLEGVLVDESVERLQARMRSKLQPIKLDELGEVIKYLTEEVYGQGRPLDSAAS